MPALTFYSSPRTDRSFSIGLAAVILFAVVEASTLGLHYFGTISANRVAAKPAVSTPAPVAAPRATVAPPPPVAQASATPATAVPPSTVVLSAADRLVKEANALNDRGDTATALARLQEASEKDPKNAHVLAEMAMIYESTKNFDRSTETWRRILDIGPSAGSDYELADAKLTKGAAAIPPTAGSPAAESSPMAATAAVPAVKGIPQGSTLGISEVTATDQADPDSETNLNLRIGVKKRPNTVIDHTKVKIQVYFYDGLPNGDVKLTDADVSYEWITPNHDWTDTDTEILAVTYVRAKNKSLSSEAALAAAAAAVNPAKKGKVVKPSPPPPDIAQRKYLGYIVRVYYNDQLQDKRAEPTKLLNLFPPPFNASSP